MKRAASAFRRGLSRAALVVTALALAPYACGPIYDFPEPVPFQGSQLWNPYDSLTGTWQRANLHAHGRAWGGLTSGAQSDAEVAQRYRELGYSVAGVSDYQRIAAQHGVDTLPIYEHGFNLGKNHQLAIGAVAVDWFEFPLWQTNSNQQYVIDRVKKRASLISLNHPNARGAYDLNAVRSLTQYDLIEIVNGPFTAEDVWDAALSAGRPVWAVASDDTHDLEDPRRTAVAWNMIDAPSASTQDVVSALQAGRSYAVLRTGAIDASNLTTLSSVTVRDNVVTAQIRGAASTFTFIGQDGAVRATAREAHAAAYTMTGHDPYVRVVITGPQTVLYLNPVIRWDGARLPQPVATVNAAWTWLQRGALALAGVGLLLLSRARRANPGVAPHRVLAPPT